MTAPEHPDIVRFSLPTPFPVGPVNVFLIKRDPPTLIDVGAKSQEGHDRLVRGLQQHGLRVADIGLVLLTHGHLDHIGLLPEVVEESGAQVVAHPSVAEYFAHYDRETANSVAFLEEVMRRCGVAEESVSAFIAARASLQALAGPVTVQRPISDGETVAGITAYHVPGHSATDILFYDPARRIAFTGDHLIRNVTPSPLIRRPRPGQANPNTLVEYQASLARTRALDIETCYPGHGLPFGQHREVIDRLLERHERRTAEVRALLETGPLTPFEIAGRLFPRLDLKILHLGLSVAVGHLDVLEDRGEVDKDLMNGVAVYRLVRPSVGVAP